MGDFFHTILIQPIFNLLVVLYNVIPGQDIGFAIIALTILIKLLLWPFMSKSLKSQKAMQALQPKIEEIKKEYGDDREGLAKAMMELYSENKVNPLAGCLPVLVQLPILIGLYRVLLVGFGADQLDMLYPFVVNPGEINHIFLGFLDLSVASIYVALLAGAFQFFQARMLMHRKQPKEVKGKKGAKDENMMAAMNKSMLTFMPIITVVIGSQLPAGLTLYWVTINAVSIVQQYIVFRGMKKEEE